MIWTSSRSMPHRVFGGPMDRLGAERADRLAGPYFGGVVMDEVQVTLPILGVGINIPGKERHRMAALTDKDISSLRV